MSRDRGGAQSANQVQTVSLCKEEIDQHEIHGFLRRSQGNPVSRILRLVILPWAISAILSHGAMAENFPQFPHLPLSEAGPTLGHELNMGVAAQPPNGRHSDSLGCRSKTPVEQPLQTIERVSGEESGPRIAEPMVFDLIRPLGAKRGEREVNVLGLVPLRRESSRVNDIQDPLGLVRRSPDHEMIEWAPEIEYAVCDGVAIEFEVPMENSRVEAYKGAAQFSFGTALNHRFIHGAQAILQYGRDSSVWTTTGLYLAGFRFNDTWSVFGMLGGRGEVFGPVADKEAEFLSNVTLFADVTERMVLGVETNLNHVIGGGTGVLFMPQVHYEIDRYWMIQGGVGARLTTGLTIPVVGFRVIREF
ncbi:hypothetical protein [Nitrospira sp. BLG_2]|uniref:hypothetical protein n=1 Tax=Nitrospira sp. BLG_2 TaxID=3397507 RepID=UPI003B9B8881